jgi:hypothetical protein
MASHDLSGPDPSRASTPSIAEGTDEVPRLIAQRDALLAELRQLEWLGSPSPEFEWPLRTCPRCGGVDPRDGGRGHASECSLGAALAAADWY